jgi:hypothetical protein
LGLGFASLLLLWPGIAAYDTVKQYEQALTGAYDDWHPPAMARLWSLLLMEHVGGTGPMLALQLTLYWAGLGLLGAALARSGARRAAWCVLLAGLSPLVADWMLVVVKDAQMLAAMVAATGIVGWYRLQDRAVPRPAAVLAGVLLGYAVLVRANSVFAVVPLALCFLRWGGVRRWWARAGMLLTTTLLALLAGNIVNHAVLGAERSHVERTLPLFDLAGIAHDAPLAAPPGLSPEEWADAERKHCYTPFYWDPFGDEKRCGEQGDALVSPDGPSHLMRDWVTTIATHPLAYAEHRLAHLNATLRVATPPDEPSAAAPTGSEPNPYGLGAFQSERSKVVETLAAAVAATPAGSPGVWLVLAAAIGWVLLGTPAQPAREVGLALSLSACLMTASFAVVSIASDLRYHLWLMMAAGLAAVMLGACRGVERRRLRIGLALMAVACTASVMARTLAGPIAI